MLPWNQPRIENQTGVYTRNGGSEHTSCTEHDKPIQSCLTGFPHGRLLKLAQTQEHRDGVRTSCCAPTPHSCRIDNLRSSQSKGLVGLELWEKQYVAGGDTLPEEICWQRKYVAGGDAMLKKGVYSQKRYLANRYI